MGWVDRIANIFGCTGGISRVSGLATSMSKCEFPFPIQTLPVEFDTDTPVLPDVKITEIWGYYDGPLVGICEIHGKEFFFLDVIYNIWRWFDNDTHKRLWSIFAVFDIDVETLRKIDLNRSRQIWQDEIDETSNIIGIFWKYEYAKEVKWE